MTGFWVETMARSPSARWEYGADVRGPTRVRRSDRGHIDQCSLDQFDPSLRREHADPAHAEELFHGDQMALRGLRGGGLHAGSSERGV